jgi:hypothetical protein
VFTARYGLGLKYTYFSIVFKLLRLVQGDRGKNLKAETRFRSRVIPYLIPGGQSDTGAAFSQSI